LKSWLWTWIDGAFRVTWQWFAARDAAVPSVGESTLSDEEVEFCPRTKRYLELGAGDA
jgi:hypothetical protein